LLYDSKLAGKNGGKNRQYWGGEFDFIFQKSCFKYRNRELIPKKKILEIPKVGLSK
jgi:hypothetical protein